MDDELVGTKKNKPHAVCIPLPAQGHINPMLTLAKLLYLNGFHITFVHTEFNHNRLIQSNGPDSLKGSPDFRFETISDGLPASNRRGVLDLPALCDALPIYGRRSFRALVLRLLEPSPESPPASCIVSDGVMGFTADVAEEFGIPVVSLFTPSACGMLGYLNYDELVKRGYFPLKDGSHLSNGYLNAELDWIPAMKGVRLRDLPTFLRSTDPNDTMFNYNLNMVKNAKRSKAIILNTFDELEPKVLHAIRTRHVDDFPDPLFTVGPLPLLLQQHANDESSLELSVTSSLWKEDVACLDWLDRRDSNSVLYVNFGSLVTTTAEEIGEIARGLAESGYPFLWAVRSDLIDGGDEAIAAAEIDPGGGDRGLIVDWCPQDRVLRHRSIGGFLTHCGWNSTLESISVGVPVICRPFFADQQLNCFFCCGDWGIGLDIGGDDEVAERGRVLAAVRELMEGERGKGFRLRAQAWKRRADVAVGPGGSSSSNFEMLVQMLKDESLSFRKRRKEGLR